MISSTQGRLQNMIISLWKCKKNILIWCFRMLRANIFSRQYYCPLYQLRWHGPLKDSSDISKSIRRLPLLFSLSNSSGWSNNSHSNTHHASWKMKDENWITIMEIKIKKCTALPMIIIYVKAEKQSQMSQSL